MLEKMSKMIAEQLNCDASEITSETSFKDDLGADSLDLFELVMALEDEYNIEIPAEELTELNTVGDVIDYQIDIEIEAYFFSQMMISRFCSLFTFREVFLLT